MNDLHHPCENWAELMSLAAAGFLTPDEEREVHRHVETCSGCRARYRQLEQLCGALDEARLPADKAEAVIVERVMSTIASDESDRPQVRAGAARSHSTFLSRPLDLWRWIMRSPTSRISATAVFVLAVTGVAIWFHGGGAKFAFADFVAPILEAKTARFKVATEMKGPPAGTVKGEVLVLDATRSRQEMVMSLNSTAQESSGPTMVMIFDWGQKKSLTLDPAAKKAMVLSLDNVPREQVAQQDTFGWFRSILLDVQDNPDVKREPLGEKEVDGRRVIGFRVSTKGMVVNLWGDPKTGMPVLAETTMSMFPDAKTTMSDFEFDVDLDESLFSLEPPPGYTVQNMTMDASMPEEADLITALRKYSEMSGGRFPDSLDLKTILIDVGKIIGKENAVEMLRERLAAANQEVDEAQIREFTELMDKMMDMQAAAGTGTPDQEEINKLEEQMGKFKDLMKPLAGAEGPSAEEVRKRTEASMQKLLKVQMPIQRGLMFATMLPPDSGVHYAGKGVSTGDADKPVFWYRPKDAKEYRVIYADLSVRSAEAPPDDPAAQPVPPVPDPQK